MLLYKYRAVNVHTINMLVLSQIYFADLNDFNDPFEGKVRPSFVDPEPTMEDLVKYIRSNTGRAEISPYLCELLRRSSKSDEEYQLMMQLTKDQTQFNRMLNTIPPLSSTEVQATLDNALWGAINDVIAQTSVFTASEICDDILMWSHYANAHRGICIGIDIEKDSVLQAGAQPVTYCDHYPGPNITGALFSVNREIEVEKVVNSVFLTKSNHWRYENEWRIVRREAPGVQHIPRTAITRIVFGCRTSDGDKRLISRLVGDTNVAIFQAEPKEQEFALGLVQIDPKQYLE